MCNSEQVRGISAKIRQNLASPCLRQLRSQDSLCQIFIYTELCYKSKYRVQLYNSLPINAFVQSLLSYNNKFFRHRGVKIFKLKSWNNSVKTERKSKLYFPFAQLPIWVSSTKKIGVKSRDIVSLSNIYCMCIKQGIHSACCSSRFLSNIT